MEIYKFLPIQKLLGSSVEITLNTGPHLVDYKSRRICGHFYQHLSHQKDSQSYSSTPMRLSSSSSSCCCNEMMGRRLRRLWCFTTFTCVYLCSLAVVLPLPQTIKPDGNYHILRPGQPFKIALFADLHFGEDAWTDWGPLQDVNSVRVMSTVLDAETPGDVITLHVHFGSLNFFFFFFYHIAV